MTRRLPPTLGPTRIRTTTAILVIVLAVCAGVYSAQHSAIQNTHKGYEQVPKDLIRTDENGTRYLAPTATTRPRITPSVPSSTSIVPSQTTSQLPSASESAESTDSLSAAPSSRDTRGQTTQTTPAPPVTTTTNARNTPPLTQPPR